MNGLEIGTKVRMKYGGTCTVLEEYGSGGQGTVYRVSYQGKEYALKWYHKGVFRGKEKEFYKNLENNIQKGAPDRSFLWPLYITDATAEGTFGYLMEKRPAEYHELTEYFVGTRRQRQIYFNSFDAIVNAAINIVQAFRQLHNKGYSYQDINNGNFFINPENGHVLICDNDNVAPFGINLGILGKQRYMAPEIVLMKNDPDKASDRFSLAVILFRLLFINHPLEGRYSTPPCMTKELERKYYGLEPIFIFDPQDTRNRPIPGTDKNLKLFWDNVYPDFVKETFCKAFGKDALTNKSSRVIEKTWLDVFMRLKASIVRCPHCGQETIIKNIGTNECIECKDKYVVPHAIKFQSTTIPLYTGTRLMMWHVDSTKDDLSTQIGRVVSNPQDIKMMGIQNTSGQTWQVTIGDGSIKALSDGKVCPIKPGFIFGCTSNTAENGTII